MSRKSSTPDTPIVRLSDVKTLRLEEQVRSLKEEDFMHKLKDASNKKRRKDY
jgi:hypothetical protein